MAADSPQTKANTEAIQAIADSAQDINSLLSNLALPNLTDNLMVQLVGGATLKMPLESIINLVGVANKTVVNLTSIKPPQLFNPDGTDVSNGFADFTLSSSNSVAFVTVNGQVIDDGEYGLVGAVLTVTPDNGFDATDDEVLVFQHVFATDATGVSFTYAAKTANYTITEDDYYVECTSGTFNVTLPNAGTVGAGKTFSIKNSGTGTIDIIAELDQFTVGVPLQLEQYDSVTVASNNTKYIIV